MGDQHANPESLIQNLLGRGLIDPETYEWVGENTTIVLLGDYFDEGYDSRLLLDLIFYYQESARKVGGNIFMLAGNHEALSLAGHIVYTKKDDLASYLSVGKDLDLCSMPRVDEREAEREGARHDSGYRQYRWALSDACYIGRRISSLDAGLVIGDTLFVHADVDLWLIKDGSPMLGEINQAYREWARLHANRRGHAPQLTRGPLHDILWGRRIIKGKEPSEVEKEAILEKILSVYGVRRIVVGHTPFPDRRIRSIFGDRFWGIDTSKVAKLGDLGEIERMIQPSSIEIFSDGTVDVWHGERKPENLSFTLPKSLQMKLCERALVWQWGEPPDSEVDGQK